MRHGILLLTLALLLASVSNAAGEVPELGPDSPGVRRYNGRVQLSLTALVIAPGKSSGLPWDGPGRFPEDVVGKIAAGVSSNVTSALFQALRLGNPPLAALADLESWTVDAFIAGAAAPDIEARIFVDSIPVGTAPKVRNSYVPTWAAGHTAALELAPFTQVAIKVVDKDLVFDDDVGVCTMQGMPYVDEHGYAIPSSFTCKGQVWAVALRVKPIDPQADTEQPEQPGASAAPQDNSRDVPRPLPGQSTKVFGFEGVKEEIFEFLLELQEHCTDLPYRQLPRNATSVMRVIVGAQGGAEELFVNGLDLKIREHCDAEITENRVGRFLNLTGKRQDISVQYRLP